MVIPDATKDERFQNNPLVTGAKCNIAVSFRMTDAYTGFEPLPVVIN